MTPMQVARRLAARGAGQAFIAAYLDEEQRRGHDLTWETCTHCEADITEPAKYQWWPTPSTQRRGPYCSWACARRAGKAIRRAEKQRRLLNLSLIDRSHLCPRPEKQAYLDEEYAVDFMNSHPEHRVDAYLRAYLCECELWHLGHWRKRKPAHQRPTEEDLAS